jgi:ion channel
VSTLKSILTFIVSPTRFIIVCIKHRVRDRDRAISIWNWIFRSVMAVGVIALYLVGNGDAVRNLRFDLGYFLLWLLPFSRINELGLAFYQDALQRFEGPDTESNITPVRRLQLLVVGYFEVAMQFGILFFCFPSGFFCPDFRSIFNALYFSTVTITTAGYGDILPKRPLSQFACMYELAIGFVILIFALGSYFTTSIQGCGASGRKNSNRTETVGGELPKSSE